MTERRADRSGFVEKDGQRIWWEYFGSGDRETIVLLNGVAMQAEWWDPLLPHLLPNFDTLVWDYPGQGRSTARDEPCYIPQLAAQLDAVADQAEVDRFHAIGLSYGSFVALDYARLYGSRLHTLTLSGTILSHEVTFQLQHDLSLRFFASGPAGFELYTHYLFERIFDEPFLQRIGPSLEAMRIRFHEELRDRVRCLRRLTEAHDAFFESLERNLPGYAAAEVPTLVLAGEHDRCIPPSIQQKVAALLPAARFEIVENAGHVPHLEQPDSFFSRLESFLGAKTIDFD